jgi:hypothetical protein
MTNKSLAKLTKRREKTQINKLEMKKGILEIQDGG